MGYLFAIITSVFFTAYVVPKKLSDQTPVRYSLFQGMGFFAAALIAYLVSRPGAADNFSDPVLLLSCAAGVIWFAASVLFLTAIDKMGLSSSNQWKNLQGPFGALFNMIFLAEYMQTNVWFVILASAFILVSAMLFNVKKPSEKADNASGILCAVLSAVGFGFYSLLQKYVTTTGHVFSQQVCISASVLISAAVYLLIREKSLNCVSHIGSRGGIMGVLGGVLFFFASFFATVSYKYLPGSVAFTIIQLNAVWTVLVGILIFKEIDFKKNRLRIIVGIVAAVAGVVMLLP